MASPTEAGTLLPAIRKIWQPQDRGIIEWARRSLIDCSHFAGEETGAYKGNDTSLGPMNTFIYLFIFAVLGFELRAYPLSHSTSPFLW
jgi:hypothetical protein